jgi:hypothetical protein
VLHGSGAAFSRGGSGRIRFPTNAADKLDFRFMADRVEGLVVFLAQSR